MCVCVCECARVCYIILGLCGQVLVLRSVGVALTITIDTWRMQGKPAIFAYTRVGTPSSQAITIQ